VERVVDSSNNVAKLSTTKRKERGFHDLKGNHKEEEKWNTTIRRAIKKK